MPNLSDLQDKLDERWDALQDVYLALPADMDTPSPIINERLSELDQAIRAFHSAYRALRDERKRLRELGE